MASKTTVASSLMITWATWPRIRPGRRLAEAGRVIAAAVPSTGEPVPPALGRARCARE